MTFASRNQKEMFFYLRRFWIFIAHQTRCSSPLYARTMSMIVEFLGRLLKISDFIVDRDRSKIRADEHQDHERSIFRDVDQAMLFQNSLVFLYR